VGHVATSLIEPAVSRVSVGNVPSMYFAAVAVAVANLVVDLAYRMLDARVQ
jgi:ABC-type dipeptide/oligopeptide/nickel transport system permease component